MNKPAKTAAKTVPTDTRRKCPLCGEPMQVVRIVKRGPRYYWVSACGYRITVTEARYNRDTRSYVNAAQRKPRIRSEDIVQ